MVAVGEEMPILEVLVEELALMEVMNCLLAEVALGIMDDQEASEKFQVTKDLQLLVKEAQKKQVEAMGVVEEARHLE